jgi:LacI family transcriptional regulator
MTIKDIAKESGYAVGTVSRVLNNHPDVSEKARETILAVVEKHHFRLNNNAKHLKQQASKGIAVIVKGSQNMLFASIVERLQGLIEEKDFVSFIYYIGEEENEVEQAESVCLERHPKGIFFLGSNLEFFRERFARLDVPCVLVTNSAAKLSFPNLSSVSTDDAAAAEAAVEYLIRLGHERIGVLGGRMERSHAAFTRCIGCEQAFRNHEMVFDKKKQYEPALFSMEEGYHAMGALLDKMPELTAVFAMADVLAVGAIRAIRDRGLRVPEDISVIGFDGIDLGNYLTPRLTTIRQKSDRIADRSMEILVDRIEEEKEAIHELVSFDIIAGESVAKVSTQK